MKIDLINIGEKVVVYCEEHNKTADVEGTINMGGIYKISIDDIAT